MSKLYFQRTLKNSVDWRCSVHNAKQNCPATVKQKGDSFTMHKGKGVRVVGSLQQWRNQSISTFEDCRTVSGPKKLLKTIIELSLTKDVYLTLIKDMYWSNWLLCSYSCFSWDSIWPLYLCLCSPCALGFCFCFFALWILKMNWKLLYIW